MPKNKPSLGDWIEGCTHPYIPVNPTDVRAYNCPVCGHTDPNAYQRCSHGGCPDGRDPRPAISPLPGKADE